MDILIGNTAAANVRMRLHEVSKVRENDRFEAELSLAAYQVITNRLMDEHLLTNQEAAIIRKRLSRMRNQLVQPKASDGPHARTKEAA